MFPECCRRGLFASPCRESAKKFLPSKKGPARARDMKWNDNDVVDDDVTALADAFSQSLGARTVDVCTLCIAKAGKACLRSARANFVCYLDGFTLLWRFRFQRSARSGLTDFSDCFEHNNWVIFLTWDLHRKSWPVLNSRWTSLIAKLKTNSLLGKIWQSSSNPNLKNWCFLKFLKPLSIRKRSFLSNWSLKCNPQTDKFANQVPKKKEGKRVQTWPQFTKKQLLGLAWWAQLKEVFYVLNWIELMFVLYRLSACVSKYSFFPENFTNLISKILPPSARSTSLWLLPTQT